jgi:phytoene dehydrogenase-like protein
MYDTKKEYLSPSMSPSIPSFCLALNVKDLHGVSVPSHLAHNSHHNNVHDQQRSSLPMQKPRVIVVGAGMGGLAVAAILARRSFKVTVYEKSSSVLGGRASSRRIKGYTLDSGIHALRGAEDGPAAQVMRMIGKPIEFAVKNSDGVLPVVYYGGKMVGAPYSTLNLIRYPLLSLTQKVKLVGMIRRASKLTAEEFGDVTVSDWLSSLKITYDERLLSHIRLFSSVAFYCDPDFDIMSARDLIRFFQAYPYDVGYPKGGWAQIVDNLKACIEENGGQIITGKTVEKVVIVSSKDNDNDSSSSDDENKIRQGSRAYGVILSGDDRVQVADYVVMNLPIKALLAMVPGMGMLLPHLSRQSSSSSLSPSTSSNEDLFGVSNVPSDKKFETTSGIVIDIVGIPKEDVNHFLPRKSDTVLTLDPCVIFRVPSKFDSTISPPGKDILTAWMPVKLSVVQDKKLVQEKFEQLTHLTETIFPGVQAKADFHRRMVFETVIGRYPGVASSHLPRLPVIFPQIDHLYFVGDAANSPGIGGSSDAAFTSAIECAEQILVRTASERNLMPADIQNR